MPITITADEVKSFIETLYATTQSSIISNKAAKFPIGTWDTLYLFSTATDSNAALDDNVLNLINAARVLLIVTFTGYQKTEGSCHDSHALKTLFLSLDLKRLSQQCELSKHIFNPSQLLLNLDIKYLESIVPNLAKYLQARQLILTRNPIFIKKNLNLGLQLLSEVDWKEFISIYQDLPAEFALSIENLPKAYPTDIKSIEGYVAALIAIYNRQPEKQGFIAELLKDLSEKLIAREDIGFPDNLGLFLAQCNQKKQQDSIANKNWTNDEEIEKSADKNDLLKAENISDDHNSPTPDTSVTKFDDALLIPSPIPPTPPGRKAKTRTPIIHDWHDKYRKSPSPEVQTATGIQEVVVKARKKALALKKTVRELFPIRNNENNQIEKISIDKARTAMAATIISQQVNTSVVKTSPSNTDSKDNISENEKIPEDKVEEKNEAKVLLLGKYSEEEFLGVDIETLKQEVGVYGFDQTCKLYFDLLKQKDQPNSNSVRILLKKAVDAYVVEQSGLTKKQSFKAIKIIDGYDEELSDDEVAKKITPSRIMDVIKKILRFIQTEETATPNEKSTKLQALVAETKSLLSFDAMLKFLEEIKEQDLKLWFAEYVLLQNNSSKELSIKQLNNVVLLSGKPTEVIEKIEDAETKADVKLDIVKPLLSASQDIIVLKELACQWGWGVIAVCLKSHTDLSKQRKLFVDQLLALSETKSSIDPDDLLVYLLSSVNTIVGKLIDLVFASDDLPDFPKVNIRNTVNPELLPLVVKAIKSNCINFIKKADPQWLAFVFDPANQFFVADEQQPMQATQQLIQIYIEQSINNLASALKKLSQIIGDEQVAADVKKAIVATVLTQPNLFSELQKNNVQLTAYVKYLDSLLMPKAAIETICIAIGKSVEEDKKSATTFAKAFSTILRDKNNSFEKEVKNIGKQLATDIERKELFANKGNRWAKFWWSLFNFFHKPKFIGADKKFSPKIDVENSAVGKVVGSNEKNVTDDAMPKCSQSPVSQPPRVGDAKSTNKQETAQAKSERKRREFVYIPYHRI